MTTIADRFELKYQETEHRRIVSGVEVIVHCHHYNARLQNTVESAQGIDGKSIIVNSAEAACYSPICEAFREGDDNAAKWLAAAGFYAHIGFGTLDFQSVEEGTIYGPSSHYVEGWATGFKQKDGPVCSFTQGYLQAAVRAVTNEVVTITEVECINTGASRCRFEIDRTQSKLAVENTKNSHGFTPKPSSYQSKLSNIDETAIINALVAMPIFGNDEGLIAAFGVYLACTPADYYNLVNVRFIEEMTKIGKFGVAKQMLFNAGETCAINTFRGIMDSPEWEGLIAPMIQDEKDSLFALVSLSNAFGWGNWYVTDHDPDESLTIESINGYEAYGALEYGEPCENPQCFMLAGVAAGMMELIYSEGSIQDRFGTFISEENDCISNQNSCCTFSVEAA